MGLELSNFEKRTSEFLDAVALFPDRDRSLAPDGEWSAAFIIHHVADAELHFAARYWHILGSENPVMPYFDEDKYPSALGYANRSLNKSLAAIVGVRAMVLDVLKDVDQSAAVRITTAPDGAIFSLADLLEKAGAHLAAHTEQLSQLRSSLS
ncbi:MAG: DinB family protein [Candidatus Planktophila sp.]